MKLKNINFTVLISIIINLIIRIPRVVYVQGLDNFLAIWEAQLILNGEFFRNGFNFLSLFGFYPFSGYPIGTLLILSGFLAISGRNIIACTILFEIFFTIVFTISVYLLSNELKLNEKIKCYFIILLTTLPNILLFSYNQTSARFPFFALLPIFLIFLLKFNREKKISFFLMAIFLTFILNLFHRMAIMLFLIIIISFTLFVIEKITKVDFLYNLHNYKIKINDQKHNKLKKKIIMLLNYLKQRIWLLSIVVLFIIGFIIFGMDLSYVSSTSKFNIYCYFKSLINSNFLYLLVQPLVDQWIHYGLVFILFIILFIMLIIPSDKNSKILTNINGNSDLLRLFFYILPFTIAYQIIYSYYFLCYLLSILGAFFIFSFLKIKKRSYLYPVYGIISGLFITLYHFFVVSVLPYLIISLFLTIVSIIVFIITLLPKLKKTISNEINKIPLKVNTFTTLTFLFILITSMFMVDRHSIYSNRDGIIYGHLTNEEIELANFLINNGYGTFDSFDNTISTRVAAISGWFYISDIHNRGVFLLGDLHIRDINCSIGSIRNLLNFQFLNCTNTNGRSIFYELITSHCYSIMALEILKSYNLKYFITASNSSKSYVWDRTINSIFIESLYVNVPIVKATDNFYIWNTSVLYS